VPVRQQAEKLRIAAAVKVPPVKESISSHATEFDETKTETENPSRR
jgi:hypothetical protein